MTITQDYLKEILHYNAKLGIFTWKKDRSPKTKKGMIAGYTYPDGYVEITLRIQNSTKGYPAHRLAWLYVYGEWPKNQIDHINGNTSDNRIINLRVASVRQNAQNQIRHRQGHLLGASWISDRNKWRAQITINGKLVHIGYFMTEQEAHKAYCKVHKEWLGYTALTGDNI